MAVSALAQSHLARSLLRLGEREWSGVLRLAGRGVEVLDGRIVYVSHAEGERRLRAFLHAAGRLPAEAPEGLDEETLLAWLDEAERWHTVREALDALWAERLAWALERAIRRGATLLLDPTRVPRRPARWTASPALFETALEALATLAARGPAERVGAVAAMHRFVWLPGVTADRAARWAPLPPEETRQLARWLERIPAGASRIAALLIGGLGQLEPLDPGHPEAGPAEVLRIRPLPLDRWLPDEDPAGTGCEDPLSPIEAAMTRAERQDAPRPTLARRWLELARGWRRHHDAPVEEARCARQAAALAPEDPFVQRAAAEACLRAADPVLAGRYAELAAALLDPLDTDPQEDERAGRIVSWFTRFAPRLGIQLETASFRRAALAAGVPEVLLDEVYARLRAGHPEGATLLAQQAARTVSSTAPQLRTALAIWACTTSPTHTDARLETASLLVEANRPHAALALLLEAAALTDDEAIARQLRVRAAEMTERAARPDLAAVALLEAFEAEPELEVLHEALAADLSAGSDRALLVSVLEELAAQGSERRFDWLMEASRGLFELGYDEMAAEAAGRALLARPDAPEALQALRLACDRGRDATLEADWLERVVRTWHARDPRRLEPILRRLAELCGERLQSPPRALWAWSRIEALLGTEEARRQAAVWRERAQMRRQALSLAEREAERSLASADAPGTADAAQRTLAALLRDWPDDRRRAAALYQEVLSRDPSDEVAHASLDRILRAMGDEDARAAALERWMHHTEPGPRRARIAERLAALHAWTGRWEASGRALLEAIEHAPPSRFLAVRLERVARRTANPSLLHRALSLQIRTGTEGTPLVRVRAALAATLETLGRAEEAAAEAMETVRLAPDHAEAAAVLLRQLHTLPGDRLQEAVELLRSAMGDSVPLWRRAAEIAADAGHLELSAIWALEAARLPPPDPSLAIAALRRAVEAMEPELVLRAASHLMEVAHLAPRKAAACYEDTVERLARAGAPDLAVRVGIEALDGLGQTTPALADRCLDLAETSDDPRLRRLALERCVARARGKRRGSLLKALAAAHREEGRLHAEVRTWLRVLHENPRDEGALRRLSVLLGRCGDYTRLAEVLALRAVRARDDVERRSILARRAAVLALGLGRLEEGIEQLEQLHVRASATERHDLTVRVAATLLSWRRPREAVQWLLRHARATLEQGESEESHRLFREAVALAEEDAGDPRLALQAVQEALQALPADAWLLDAFDRLTGRLEDEDTVSVFYERRIAEALGRYGRRAARYRWGRWLQRHGRSERASRLFLQALEEIPSEGVLLEALLRCAETSDSWRDAVAGLRRVAEATRDPSVARRLTERAAAILDERLEEPVVALRSLLEVAERAGISDSLRERTAILLERLDAEGNEATVPLRARAKELLESHRPTLLLEERPADEPTGPLEGPPSGHDPTDQTAPSVEPLSPPPIASRWHAAPRTGDSDSAPNLDESLTRARRDPLEAAVLRSLLQEAERCGAGAVARAARLVLSAVDFEAPGDSHAIPTEPFALGLPLSLAHEAVPSALRQMLASAWRHTRSMLIRPLSAWGILGTERMPLFARRPLARAHVQLMGASLGEDVVVYLHEPRSAALQLLPTRPVALIVAPSLEQRSTQELWAILGAGLFWAHPEHLFVSTASPSEALERIAALCAAFGAGADPPTDTHLATRVTRLWESIPPQAQAHLREMFRDLDGRCVPEEIVASVRRAGLRAGLLACSDLRTALRALEALDITDAERTDLAAFLLSDTVIGTLAEREEEAAPPPS